MGQTLRQPGSKPVYLEENQFLDNESGGLWHGFFTRQGGVSQGIYTSLNCGLGSEDDRNAVMENACLVTQAAGAQDLVTLYQIHSAECVEVTEPWMEGQRPQADAMVTTKPGLALGVLTADCAPVLFHGRGDNGPVIGAAHAGWSGALKGVLGATVQAMQALGAENIKACIGPCIQKASYEVSEEFAAPFMAEDPIHEHFFQAGRRTGHLMFDLPGYCAKKLADSGVLPVSIMPHDTYADEEHFYSYRRKTHREEPDYGRQISVIVIK